MGVRVIECCKSDGRLAFRAGRVLPEAAIATRRGFAPFRHTGYTPCRNEARRPERRPRPLSLVPALLGGARAAGQDAPSSTPPAPEARNLPLVEAILNRELGRRLGPAAQWQVLVTASDEQRAAGHLPKVEIRGTNLTFLTP